MFRGKGDRESLVPSYLLALTLLPDPDVRNSFAPNASCPMQFVWQCRLSSRSYTSHDGSAQMKMATVEGEEVAGGCQRQMRISKVFRVWQRTTTSTAATVAES